MRLKELRKRSNKTQVEIAKYLNISQEKYSRLEAEKTNIDVATLIQLADYFHTTVDYLIEHDVPYLIDKGLFNDEQLDVIEKIKTLDKEQCKLIATYIDGLKDGKLKK